MKTTFEGIFGLGIIWLSKRAATTKATNATRPWPIYRAIRIRRRMERRRMSRRRMNRRRAAVGLSTSPNKIDALLLLVTFFEIFPIRTYGWSFQFRASSILNQFWINSKVVAAKDGYTYLLRPWTPNPQIPKLIYNKNNTQRLNRHHFHLAISLTARNSQMKSQDGWPTSLT